MFTTTIALTTAAADTITIEFPAGTTSGTTIANDIAEAHVTVNNTQAASIATSGRRLSITPGAGVAAGTVTVAITATKITNPAPEGTSYTLKVYTSKEPTAVTSNAYIVDSVVTAGTPVNAITEVDTASQYTVPVTLVTGLTALAADTITITFPDTTTVPTSISNAAYVTVAGTVLTSTSAYSASGQTVTLTTPVDVSSGGEAKNIVFAVGVGIKNPKSVESNWTLKIYTSQDRAVATSGTYATTNAAEAKITQVVWETKDAYIPLNTCSSGFKIETRDVNGVAATVTNPTTFNVGADGGTFYSNANCSTITTTVAIAQSASASAGDNLYYKNATAGTKTLTATPAGSQTWTAASATVIVNPALQLYGAGELKDSYATFALAIAGALPYDTIKVAASTYDEVVTVNKANLTIESIDGAASTTLTSTGTTVTVDAANVTVGGTGKGFTIKSTSGTNPVVNVGTTSGATIDGNSIIGAMDGALGNGGLIAVGNQDSTVASNVTIKNNTIVALKSVTTAEVAGVRMDAKDSTLEGNSFTDGDGTTTQAVDSGIWLNHVEANAAGAGVTSLTIRNNTFTGAIGKRTHQGASKGAGAVELYNIDGSVTISGNTIQNANDGIYFGSGSDVASGATVTIKQNTISGNVWGIESKAEGSGTITAKYNDITGNTSWGLLQVYRADGDHDIVINAQHNWWGSASGPLHTASNPSGQGNKVGRDDAAGKDANYSPWLAAAQAGVVSSGKAQYATSVVLSNKATQSGSTWSGGWNTFSTPIALDAAGDTWAEVLDLAGLTTSDVTIYEWNGTTFTVPTTIEPLKGYFVQLKTTSAKSLTIRYSTQLNPAWTRDLTTGWQLISLAKLSGYAANLALASISGKFSQVIDPISGVVLDTTSGTTDTMAVGKGYWAFMTASGTLAGFSTTPVAFDAVP
ncbi:MAG: hypothetical protein HYY01_15300 [Chloroflexi bacterium]|nr:hypothetical protein [Chloroflexota bacterium]